MFIRVCGRWASSAREVIEAKISIRKGHLLLIPSHTSTPNRERKIEEHILQWTPRISKCNWTTKKIRSR